MSVEAVGVINTVSARTRGFALLGLIGATSVLLSATRSVGGFAIWAASLALAAVVFSHMEENFVADNDTIVHTTWLRTVTLKRSEIVHIERPDPESSVRSLLLADSHRRAISIPMSRIHADARLSTSLAPYLRSN